MNSQKSNEMIYTETSPGVTNDLIPIFMRLLQIFRYRKRVIFATLYCFALVGLIYYLLAPRYYDSTAKLLIEEQRLDSLSRVGNSDESGKTMETHRGLVVSPVVIQEAIVQLPPEHRIDLQDSPQKEWVKSIARRLNAKTTRKTNFIEVSYLSLHPESAAAVVNAVIEAYLNFVDEHHKGAAGEISKVLSEEREQLQHDLNQKQNELQQFRQQVGHLSVSSEDGVVEPMIQRAIQLNEALLEAQEKRLKLQANLVSVEADLERGEDVSQLVMNVEADLGRQLMLASLGLSPQDMKLLGEQQKKLLETQEKLQSLSADYGPNHPQIVEFKQQIQSITHYLNTYHSANSGRRDSLNEAMPSHTILNMLKQSVRQAVNEEQQLHNSFELARAEASRHSDALVQLHMLERDVIRKESLYDSLSNKIASIDLSQGHAPINATVVREPLASEIPATPQLRIIAAICLIGGTIFGCLIAYIQDVLDDRFNSPEELSNQLQLPVLAMVRDLEMLSGDGLASVHTNAKPGSIETEAFRTLRTSISLTGDVSDRILISSSEPGDGKTTISANLSVALAQAGKRTLVIDADLRRPGFTTLLNLKGRPGVADVLSAQELPEVTAPPLVQHTEVEGLDVLPVGLRRPNPAELLSSNTFVELLAWADSQYDRVIVDCPPVLAVSDAQIVGQLVDGAILVVRPEKNHRRAVIRAVESFRGAGCRVLGVVVNGVTQGSSGYGYGYGYGYGDDYGHEDASSLPADLDDPEQNPKSLDMLSTSTPMIPKRAEDSIRPRRAA